MIILCFAAGLILAIVSFALQNPQRAAKEFDQSKQMLIAAKILTPEGSFELLEKDGTLLPASFDLNKEILTHLPKGRPPQKASDEEIKALAKVRIRPFFTDAKGNLFSLGEKGIDLPTYLEENKQSGYAAAENKLVYAILPNTEKGAALSDDAIIKDLSSVYAFIIPVSGFGLWAPIYGYLALFPDGDTVIGTTWYEHAETPGLGANIAEFWWQKQFYGKVIFQESADGKTDFAKDPIGLIVVKGKVQEVYGNSPKGKSAVDGMSGATLTGDGVTAAYRNSLSPYRAFFQKIQASAKNG